MSPASVTQPKGLATGQAQRGYSGEIWELSWVPKGSEA